MSDFFVKDYHMHTRYSPDSGQDEGALISTAIKKGLKEIALTDHLDIDYAKNCRHIIDYDEYFTTMGALKARFSDSISILIGVECGYMRSMSSVNADIIAKHPFEYVINSIHNTVRGDCYSRSFFDGITKHHAYSLYLEAVRESLDAPYRYDAVGHLGFIVRNAPFADVDMYYDDYAALLDDILKTIIAKDKILEINTNLGTPLSPFSPNEQILQRYHEMGGRNVVLASDAHWAQRLADGFDKPQVVKMAELFGKA